MSRRNLKTDNWINRILPSRLTFHSALWTSIALEDNSTSRGLARASSDKKAIFAEGGASGWGCASRSWKASTEADRRKAWLLSIGCLDEHCKTLTTEQWDSTFIACLFQFLRLCVRLSQQILSKQCTIFNLSLFLYVRHVKRGLTRNRYKN